MDKAEARMREAEKRLEEMQVGKCDDAVFKSNFDQLNSLVLELEGKVQRNENHCTALDNYLDKYQPVRMQGMIGDTLYACLYGAERRKHELYDQDKISLLYR